MHWDESHLNEIVLYPTDINARQIGSNIEFIADASIEQEDVPENIHEKFVEQDFDYAPIRPYSTSRTYYDVGNRELKEISEEQYLDYNSTILSCLNVLTEYPFAIIRHPDEADYKIVTPADFNSRIAKTYLYTYFATAAQKVTQLIEGEYDTEDILPTYLANRNRSKAADRWAEAREEGHRLHVAEFMNLTDLKVVVANTAEFREKIGFSSKNKTRDAFDKISKYRDKVMHANRTMITQKEDIVDLAESIDECISLSEEVEVGEDFFGSSVVSDGELEK